MTSVLPQQQPPAVEQAAAVGCPAAVIRALCGRELVRFFRQRNRVIGALGQPLVFWILFAAGLGPSFRMPGQQAGVSYGEYFFPGVVVLIILFTAIFATISIIEDRREGFLQSVLVAPIPRWSMVLGKLLGGTLIALVQALVFLALGLAVGLKFTLLSVLAISAFLFILSLALTGLGFIIAWRMDSTQGFHAIMSVFLMPMWLLSGAFFPAGPGWLGWVVRLNPLTYGVAGLRRLLYWASANTLPAELPSAATCWIITGLFAAVTLALSWRVAAYRTTGDLL
jgi:ABC-2 type transport system permease protein